MREIITAAFIGVAILLFLASIPLKLRKVKPNWWYGLRTPTIVKNPDIWYPINQAAAQQAMVLAVLMVVVAMVTYYGFDALSFELITAINASFAVIGLSIITINGIVKARKLARK
ncbi:MAG: SdpI family protein [Gammaproteobacteria bacterium]|nr:SdpI family protein [Gammaproteobacteria bacterium]